MIVRFIGHCRERFFLKQKMKRYLFIFNFIFVKKTYSDNEKKNKKIIIIFAFYFYFSRINMTNVYKKLNKKQFFPLFNKYKYIRLFVLHHL